MIYDFMKHIASSQKTIVVTLRNLINLQNYSSLKNSYVGTKKKQRKTLAMRVLQSYNIHVFMFEF